MIKRYLFDKLCLLVLHILGVLYVGWLRAECFVVEFFDRQGIAGNKQK
ncbi:hypothetical protein [Pedobacter sp. SYSU D00535]|nr:hypothetical protein [Pedobacter sp. SYSU D00535]